MKIQVLAIQRSKYFNSIYNKFIVAIDQRLLTGEKKIYNCCDLKSIHKGIISLIEKDQNCSFYVSNMNFSESSRQIYSALSYPHPVQPTTLLLRSLILFDIIMKFMSSSHHLTGWIATECVKIKLTAQAHSLKLKPSLLVSGCFSKPPFLSCFSSYIVLESSSSMKHSPSLR